MPLTIKDIETKVDSTALLMRPLSDWRIPLSDEVNVYVYDEKYIAKRFDQIHYQFVDKDTAKEILVDNLYALLRYKYFPRVTEEIDKRIDQIVSSFTANLKTTLKKVSFDKASDCIYLSMIPDYCIAFRNGVYNFKDDTWLFKYDIVELPKLSNKIYIYPKEYAVTWYFNYNFEPLPINISTTKLEDFIKIFKKITADPKTKNYCFELMYNIAHDSSDIFDLSRFEHLCEITGYTVLQSFSQFFVMMIGSGQNGKNSLFDGCFTHRIIPRPASNDLDEIETDKFITGALENKAQNIFLETSAKTYTESKMIKALTGSMYQTIQPKGINKYSGIINCKYVFAGNDQDKIKFSDTTTGFRRRINMFEIWYRWDNDKRFLKKGDYYDTTFSDNLHELKDDTMNTTAYIYFAMMGIKHGTANFTKSFKFTSNDWDEKYSDIDFDLKEKLDALTIEKILRYIRTNDRTMEEAKTMFFDCVEKTRLYNSKSMKMYGVESLEKMIRLFENTEDFISYFSDNDCYMSLRSLQNIIHDAGTAINFSNSLKKLYKVKEFQKLYNNKGYVKIGFSGKRMKILS